MLTSRFATLDLIVCSEKSLIDAEEFAIGSDALLWLTRAIEYIKVFLTLFLADHAQRHAQGQASQAQVHDLQVKSKDIGDLFQFAYDATLKKHHGWVVRKLFAVCLYAAPSRSDLIKLLASPSTSSPTGDKPVSEEAKQIEENVIFEAIENYLVNVGTNIDAIHTIFKQNNVDYNN